MEKIYKMKMPGKLFFSIGYISVICLFICSGCTKKVTLDSLIEEMTTRETLSYFPKNQYTHRQFSSYNPASVSPDKEGWYENFDMSHFLRVENNNGKREFVMLDAEGPGAIVRWWMTFYKAQTGTIRIYVDHDSIPVIIGTPGELLSGKLLTDSPLAVSLQAGAPIGEEGRDYDHNFYIPLPFKKHCKITYECDSLVLRYENEGIPVLKGYYWPDVFYNIGYRSYTDNTKLESVTHKTLKEARAEIDKAGKVLQSDIAFSSPGIDFEKEILPGDSLIIIISRDKHAVSHLMVEMQADNMQQSLRSVVLKGTFDNYQTIWAPIGEFFGTGYSLNPHKTWMNKRNETGIMESYWTMPFREKCTLSFINYGKDTVLLKGLAGLTGYKWTPESMYFGASWHEYYHINSRDENGSPFDLNFVDISGKGVYVGDQLTLFNNTYFWWGEGDEKIFVDKESFPSSFGTGSEDYYGYSFARPEPFSHPFLSQPEGKGNTNWGITVNMRHRSLDAIPFNSSISSNIEMWHWANVRLNIALTSYFYVLPPFSINIVPDIEGVKNPVAIKRNDIKIEDQNTK